MEEETVTFVINQFILAFFNFINSRVDAYRILKQKTIAHAVNFIAYAVVVGALIWLFKMNWPNGILFCFSAFFQRQLTFDIPLNKKRGLKWDYQSAANPPKALLDRIERIVFPDNDGERIAIFYMAMWAITIIIKAFFLWK